LRILFDLTTSKNTLFFYPMIREAERRGHKVITTTRIYREANQLQEMLGLKPYVIGSHGGETLRGKMEVHIIRMAQLIPLVERVDAVVCLSNPDSSRAAFGLGKPLFCFNDIPEAEAQSRLTIPLATWVLSPSIIPKEMFLRYGSPREGIWQYDALDPIIWLKDKKVDRSILNKLGLDTSKPVVVFRESEIKAAYLMSKGEIALGAVSRLISLRPDIQFVCKPRYDANYVKAKLPGAHVIEEVIDFQSLLACADLFIGGGGTCNIEAAYWGTPVISCRPIETIYENWLIEKGLSVKAKSVEEAVSMAEKLMGKRNDELAQQVFGGIEFPLKEVIDLIEECG
jgi:hypothetical protein